MIIQWRRDIEQFETIASCLINRVGVIIIVTTQHYNCHEKYYKHSNLILYYYILSFWCNKGNDGKNLEFASKSAPPLYWYDNNLI